MTMRHRDPLTGQELIHSSPYDLGNVEHAAQKTTDTTKNVSTVGQDTEPMSADRRGSPIFYNLLERMADLHDKKSHDYASNDDPFGNYHFAGRLSRLFANTDDAGFVGRFGEKLFRLANLENNGKYPLNESIEDTELDLCVIVTLWIADRRHRRKKDGIK